MGNDIEIRVRVANQTSAGVAGVTASLRGLKSAADSAAQGLRTLGTRSAASSQALRLVERRAQDATRALTALSAAGDIRLTARLDNQTNAGIDNIKAGLRALKRESPVLLRARFEGDAGQITAAAGSMRDLRNDAQRAGTAFTSLAGRSTAAAAALNAVQQQAEDASRALRTLRGRATAAAAAMGELRTASAGAANSLRSFNTRAQTAHNRLDGMADRTRTLRSDTDDLDGSMRRLTTTLGGLRGSNGSVNVNASSDSVNGLRKAALLLAPALIPIAAAATPIVTSVGAASVAVGAFGLAIAGQISQIGDASDAQKKYTEAVAQHGKASEEAGKAEGVYLAQVEALDPATRRAAASLTVFKDQYKQWSTALAGDTMPVFTKGLAVAGALLPKLTPAVKGASTELDRLMTILAGGVNSGGFSKFMESFATFSTGVLSKANDSLVRFMRTMSEGRGSSQFTEFMAYVKTAGPQVGQTLGNLARALAHVVAAASDTGLSMLGFVNAVAKLVNAIPSGVLSTFLQFAVALKAVKLAAAGMAALGGLSSAATAIGAMRTAAAGAVGPIAGLRAAFMALSVGMRTALITTGIGAVVVALGMLSSQGSKTPPDVDKVTTSLKALADTGKNTGEAAKAWGSDFAGLSKSLSDLNPTGFDGFLQGWAEFLGTDSTQVKNSKESIDSLDQSLAGLVRGGKANVAAVALENIGKKLSPKKFEELKKSLDDYKSGIADAALESKLTAQAQGLFGEQAASVQKQLDGQKRSADSLRQSIEALNDANRSALGGMIGFEASIDAAAKAAKDNAGSLDMVNGHLDVNSPKAQAAATALNDLAAKTKEAALANRESTGTWDGAIAIYERGRQQFIKNARAMGLTKDEATALAEQIMNIPDDKTTLLKMNAEDAQAGVEAFNAAIKKTPGAKSVTLQALSASAESVLATFGLKVKRLPNGKVTVTAASGAALSAIGNVAAAIGRLNGKSANTYVNTYQRTYFQTIGRPGQTVPASHRPDLATGGRVPGYAAGDRVQLAPTGLLSGPGSGTSDGILALFASGAVGNVSDTEFVVNAQSTKKYLPLLEAINKNKIPGFASGGLTSGQVKGLYTAKDMASLSSTISDVRTRIKDKTSGGTESRLLHTLDSVAKKLVTYEKSLIGVNKSLDAAKTKLNDLKTASAQAATSVKEGILGEATITKAAGADDSRATINTILSRMNASAANAGQLDSALKVLKGRGLSSTLLKQVADAGVEGGGLETAQALMGASSGQIKSLNTLQGQLTTSAASAGKTAADAMYATAIRTQTAAVTNLTRSQDRLENAMAKLAVSLDKAVGRAIGRKAAGGVVGAAASGGVRGGLTWVGEHEPELLQLPAGSRVWSGPDSRRKARETSAPWAALASTPRRPAYTGGGAVAVGGRMLVVQLHVGGRQFGEVVIDPLREAIHHRGGNVQAALGKG